jgi:hypothetical protein
MEDCSVDTTRSASASRKPWHRWLALVAGLLLSLAAPRLAVAAPPAPIVMGTDMDESTFSGMWLRRIYVEAFRRMEVPLEFAIFPTVRVSSELDRGNVDGEPVRVHGYADTHPNLVRVEEPVFDVVFALYAADPALRLSRLEDLPATTLLGDYRRGVGVCETALKRWLPAARLSDVTTTAQGLKKLLARRTDLYCDINLVVTTELAMPEFSGTDKVRRLLDVGTLALYPYLHKRHAALAPRLAATLRQMKAEGLIERYRTDAERAIGLVR